MDDLFARTHSFPICAPFVTPAILEQPAQSAQRSEFLVGAATGIVARQRGLDQRAAVTTPERRVHLLIDIETGRDVQDLIQLDHRISAAARAGFSFDQLAIREWLADEDMDDLARTRLAVARLLRIINVELRFAVAPILFVLKKSGGELRLGGCGEEQEKGGLHG